MNGGRQMGVVEIEHVGAGGVEEGGAQGIHAFAPADHGRLLTIGEFGQRLQRGLHRAGAAPRQRYGKKIHQRLLGLVTDRLGDIAPGKLDGEAGELLGGAGSVQHGAILAVAA
jgi:hypothetical protein